MPDKQITCSDCGKTFTFSEGEQDFYQQKNMSDPKRCKECRQAKKEQRSGSRGGYDRY